MQAGRRTPIAAVLTGFLLATALVATAPTTPAAAAGTAQPTLVSALPSTATPAVLDGTVFAIAQVGNRVLLGGTFTSARSAGSSTTVTRSRVLSFDPASGVLDPAFAPTLDGEVQGLLAGPTPGTAYVFGAFKTVGGVASRGVALVSVATGALVPGFHPAVVDGEVWDGRLVGGRLIVVGGFAHVGGAAHSGIAALVPATGAVDPYVAVQLTQHHNTTGTGSMGAVGGRRIDVTPDGTRAVVVGNFRLADGVLHDQVVTLVLGSTAATVDAGWNTTQYTALCLSGAYDSYVRDVEFSPDGSYFVVVATGGNGTNTDGSKALCDTAARWDTAARGTALRPTWVDYTGRDTLLSVAVTGTAVYVGGHERWLNNSLGPNSAGPGAVPRPGLGALDPSNGLPYSWNPGRNPRGAGTYALLATPQGLYAGYDTTYIGNRKYLRQRVAFFPLAGGETLPSTATGSLPGRVLLVGPRSGSGYADTVVTRTFDGTTAGAAIPLAGSAGTAWGSARGSVEVGQQLFYGMADGLLYARSFDGTTLGAAAAVDPYDDPVWSNVQTGSGQTYRGLVPRLYGTQMQSVGGMVVSGARIYYAVTGHARLSWRWFTAESGIVGADETLAGGTVDFSHVAGMFLSGTTLYWADANDGSLHAVTWAGGAPSSATDHVVSGPGTDGIDWRARGLFLVP